MKTGFQGNSQKRPPLTIKAVSILTLVFLLIPQAIESHAQDIEDGGRINVRVADPQGAIIPRAEVTLYTRDNRVRIATLTDSNGSCTFKRLAAGEYLIKVEAPGFAPAAAQSRQIERGASTTLQITMPSQASMRKLSSLRKARHKQSTKFPRPSRLLIKRRLMTEMSRPSQRHYGQCRACESNSLAGQARSRRSKPEACAMRTRLF